MNAEQIRQYIAHAKDRGNGKSGFDQEQHIQLTQALMLMEIAAQLSEANEPRVEVGESSWVTLRFKKVRRTVDRREVSSVIEVGAITGLPPHCQVTLRGGSNIILTEGTHAEVCAKLGIPVEGQ